MTTEPDPHGAQTQADDDADTDDELAGEDAKLRAMRSVWLAMRDEEPSSGGLAELLAAARSKADELAPQPTLWQRLIAGLRRPPVFAFATVLVLLGGALVVGRQVKDAPMPVAVVRDEPSRAAGSAPRGVDSERASGLSEPEALPGEATRNPALRDPAAHDQPLPAPAPAAPRDEVAGDVPSITTPPAAPPPPAGPGRLASPATPSPSASPRPPNAVAPPPGAAGPRAPARRPATSGDLRSELHPPIGNHAPDDDASKLSAAPPAPPSARPTGSSSTVTTDTAASAPPSAERKEVATPPRPRSGATPTALYRRCEAAAARGDCAEVRRLVDQIAAIDPGYRARAAKDARIAACLAP